MSTSSVHKILKLAKNYLYKVSVVHELNEDEYDHRTEFRELAYYKIAILSTISVSQMNVLLPDQLIDIIADIGPIKPSRLQGTSYSMTSETKYMGEYSWKSYYWSHFVNKILNPFFKNHLF